MKPASRPVVTWVTQGLALAAGWAIYQGMESHDQGGAIANPSPAPTKASDRSTAAEKTGERILAKILQKVASEPDPRGIAALRARQMALDPKIAERIDTIGIPEDFVAAFEELLAKLAGTTSWNSNNLADPVALGFLWMSKDPQAFFTWLNREPANSGVIGHLIVSRAFAELYRREGPDTVIPLIAMAGKHNQSLINNLAQLMATSGDAAGILKARDLFSAGGWNQFAQNIGSAWPDDQLDALTRLAVECDEPMLAIGHKVHSPEQGTYLAGLLADESLPEDFRRRISENENARYGIARDPRVPLEIRLQNGAARDQLVRGDVQYLLAADRDWGNAFRNGQATAQEILDHIYAGTPELAKLEPDAIRELVFRELAEENPAQAMALLKDLPEAERDELALLTSRSHFENVEPHKFLEMIQQVPVDTPAQWEGRLDAWNRRGFTNHERLQDGYVEWIQQLPPGIDREMGLYSLARAVDAGNPELARQLRAQVTDPELQNRISLHR